MTKRVLNKRDLCLLATSELKGERPMLYKDITYDNGFTERFYFDETEEEEALRISRINSISKFPSANCRDAPKKRPRRQGKSKKLGMSI
jgi:hypothetical protein